MSALCAREPTGDAEPLWGSGHDEPASRRPDRGFEEGVPPAGLGPGVGNSAAVPGLWVALHPYLTRIGLGVHPCCETEPLQPLR